MSTRVHAWTYTRVLTRALTHIHTQIHVLYFPYTRTDVYKYVCTRTTVGIFAVIRLALIVYLHCVRYIYARTFQQT